MSENEIPDTESRGDPSDEQDGKVGPRLLQFRVSPSLHQAITQVADQRKFASYAEACRTVMAVWARSAEVQELVDQNARLARMGQATEPAA